MLTVFAAVAELEREYILQRQREGIAIAKRNGVYKGRQKVAVPPGFEALYARYQRRELSKSALAGMIGVSRPTLERIIKEASA